MKTLSKKTYLLYGIGVSYAMIDQIFNQWVQYFYIPPENAVGMTPILTPLYLTIGFVLMRFIDAIADLVVGYASDRSTSKFGRRSIFMIIGGVPLVASMILFFFPPAGSQLFKMFCFVIVGSVFFTAYTLVGGPYNAMIPDITNTKEERINLSTIQSVFRLIFTAIPMILSGILISKLGKGNTVLGIRSTIIIFSILGGIGIYVCSLLIGEKNLTKNKPEPKHRGFVESVKYIWNKEITLYFLGFFCFFSGFNIIRNVLAYYVKLIMLKDEGMITIVSAVLFGASAVCFPITSKFIKKYDYKKIMIVDMVLIILGVLGLIFMGSKSIYITYAMFGLIGIGVSGSAFILPPGMLSEITFEISKKREISVEGLLFGVQGFFLKLAFLVQSIITIFALVFRSKATSEGLKSATPQGVYLSLFFAILLLVLSIIFYSMKKNEIYE